MVHVLDGSPEAIREEDLKVLGSNIHYHHLPVGINDRLSFVLDVIGTEYAALLSDDEFFIPSALAACIRELDAERDMVACGGRCMSFSPSPFGIMGAPGYTSQANYSITASDPVDRMVYHMHPYTPSTIYSVVRSEGWVRIMRLMVQKEFPVYAMGELQFEVAVCYLGKSKVIQRLMWMRSGENPQLAGTSISLNPENRIWDWWINPDKEPERNEFLDIMSKGLAQGPEEESIAREGVVRGIGAYVHAYKDISTKRSFMQTIEGAVRSAIPPYLKVFMKKIVYPLRRLQGQSTPLLSAAQDLSGTGVAVDFEELAHIESLVLDFHQMKK